MAQLIPSMHTFLKAIQDAVTNQLTGAELGGAIATGEIAAVVGGVSGPDVAIAKGQAVVLLSVEGNTDNVLIGATGSELFPLTPGSHVILAPTNLNLVSFKGVTETQTIQYIVEQAAA